MIRNRNALIVTIVVLLAGLCVTWFLLNFEKVPRQRTMEYSARAKQNPFLAAERLLTRMGLATTSSPTLIDLPEQSDAAVFLLGDRSNWVGRRLQQVLDWVENGGRLVVATPRRKVGDDDWEFDRSELLRDELLSRLGIDVAYVDGGGSYDSEPEELEVRLPDGGSVDVEFRRDQKLQWRGLGAPSYRVVDSENDDQVLLLITEYGFGSVTVMVDTGWMTNRRIAAREHAKFLWHLIDSRGASQASIIRGAEVPGVFALLFEHAWIVVLAFVSLVLAYLWRAGARFGPPLGASDGERRSILEHLSAAGQFLWRGRAQHALVKTMRDGVERDLYRRRPGLHSLSEPDRIRRIAELTGMNEKRVASALTGATPSDALQFTRVVRDLQTLISKHD